MNNKTEKIPGTKVLPKKFCIDEIEFEQIKNLQSLPDEIVIGFYKSKGALKKTSFIKKVTLF